MCAAAGVVTLYNKVMRGSETITFATFSLKRSCEAIFYDYKQNNAILKIKIFAKFDGLWTPNEGINQRKLKIWANVANKICFGHT